MNVGDDPDGPFLLRVDGLLEGLVRAQGAVTVSWAAVLRGELGDEELELLFAKVVAAAEGLAIVLAGYDQVGSA